MRDTDGDGHGLYRLYQQFHESDYSPTFDLYGLASNREDVRRFIEYFEQTDILVELLGEEPEWPEPGEAPAIFHCYIGIPKGQKDVFEDHWQKAKHALNHAAYAPGLFDYLGAKEEAKSQRKVMKRLGIDLKKQP